MGSVAFAAATHFRADDVAVLRPNVLGGHASGELVVAPNMTAAQAYGMASDLIRPQQAAVLSRWSE